MLYIEDRIDRFTPADFERMLAEVSGQRRLAVDRIKGFGGKLQSLLAYRLLQQAVMQEFQIDPIPDFAFTDKGKPYFAELPGVHFSLSHCPAAVACAVDSRPCGVDIETIRPLRRELAEYVLSPAEFGQIMASADPAREFIRLWTMKESLCKLLGTGIPGKERLRTLLADHPEAVFDHRFGLGYICTLSTFSK